MQFNRRNTVLLVAVAAGATTLLTPMLAAGAASSLPADTPTTSASASASASASPTVTPSASPTATPTATPTPTVTPTVTTSPGVVPPTITAHVSSAHPESDGWFRTQVDITFTCTAGSSELASQCPTPITLTKVGRGVSTTQTVSDTDGGTASVTVTENIDLGAPTMRSVQPRKGTCHAYDPVSGVASCKVLKSEFTRNGVIHAAWVAVATDHAGNVNKVYGRY